MTLQDAITEAQTTSVELARTVWVCSMVYNGALVYFTSTEEPLRTDRIEGVAERGAFRPAAAQRYVSDMQSLYGDEQWYIRDLATGELLPTAYSSRERAEAAIARLDAGV